MIVSALASLALFGAPNARNYRSHSTMGILPEMTISWRGGRGPQAAKQGSPDSDAEKAPDSDTGEP